MFVVDNKSLRKMFTDHKFPALLCILTIFMVIVMETRHPYFFLQGDNRLQHLSCYVHNIRALLGGEFPLFNFHQYLGMPTSIQYAPLYPINYIALCLSKLLLGNYLGTMEFIAVIHLVIAALGFFYLMRLFDLEEISCSFGAIAWSFCGFVITVGNASIPILEHAAYLPWVLLFAIKQMHQNSYMNLIKLSGTRLLILLIGYPQFYVYTVTFEIITVMMLCVANNYKHKPDQASMLHQSTALNSSYYPSFTKNSLYYSLSHISVLIIALPLLLPTIYQASISVSRKNVLEWKQYVSHSYNLILWLTGLVAPFTEPSHITWNEQHFISHVGYLTLIFALIALFKIDKTRKGKYILIFTIIALLSLLWSADIVLTKIIYYIPVFNKFRHPFKLEFFTSFYMIIVSSFGCDVLYKKIFSENYTRYSISRGLIAVLFILHISNFIFNYAMLRQHMFGSQFDEVPFEEPLKKELHDGRIVSVGLDTIDDGEKVFMGFTVPLIGYNYATLWDLYHFGGYDTLVSEKNFLAALQFSFSSVVKVPFNTSMDNLLKVSLEYFRKWGVKWYVVDKNIPVTNYGNLVFYQGDKFRNIFYDSAAKPFAYWSGNPDDPNIQYEFRTNSIEVNALRPSSGTLIINVLYNPFFVATVDGVKFEITETRDGQMSVNVPGGRHSIVVKYSDPYFWYGAIISIVFIVMIILYGCTMKYTMIRKARHPSHVKT